jgi:hypothetical protein
MDQHSPLSMATMVPSTGMTIAANHSHQVTGLDQHSMEPTVMLPMDPHSPLSKLKMVLESVQSWQQNDHLQTHTSSS